VAALVQLRSVRPSAPARRDVAGTLFVVGAAALAVAAVLPIASRPPDAAATFAEASFDDLLDELDAGADRAAATLAGDLPAAEEARRRGYDRLRDLAREPGLERRTILLFDPYGELELWWGPGILGDLRFDDLAKSGWGFDQSALSATPYAARELRDGRGRAWRLVVGESFRRDGALPLAEADRGRWSADAWRLRTGASGRRPELVLDGPLRGGERFPRASFVTLAALAIGLGLAVVAGRRASVTSLQGPGATLEIALLAAAATATFARGAGSDPRSIAAVAAASALAVGGWIVGRSPISRSVARLAAGAATAGVVVLARSVATPALDLNGTLVGSATAAAWRVAATALVAAALGLAGSAAGAQGRRSAGLGPALLAALGVVGSLMVVEGALLDLALLALAGVAAASVARSVRPRGLPGRLAVGGLAGLLAASAWLVGAQEAQRDRAEVELASLLPPAPAELEALRARIQREIRGLADVALERLDADAAPVPSDLAYAIWRGTSLARHDVLSALTVVPPGGDPIRFSYGLPIHEDGRIDLSPARWVDLAPEAWQARRIEDVQARLRFDGTIWEVRWGLVPRPGFGRAAETARSRDLEELVLQRGTGERGAFSGLEDGIVPVLYGADGLPSSTPWVEGTPARNAAWLTSGDWISGIRTPSGTACVRASGSEELAVGLFQVHPPLLEGLERVGNFAVGGWMAAGLLLVPGFAASRRRGAMAAASRHLWRSYSRRLLVLFSLVLLLPLGVVYLVLARSIESRLETQQRASTLEALRGSQRVLGEYVLTLEPGFGIGTALDDRLLEWLARVVGSDVHLYWGSEVYASSKRDLFAAGLVPRRLSGEVWERIHLLGERVVRRGGRAAGVEQREVYAPLEIPGLPASATKLVLALPLFGQEEELAEEVSRLQRRALLGTLALAALLALSGAVLARRFTRPIDEIVAGTRRIAEGAPRLDYAPKVEELEAITVAIDSMAERIAEARERLLDEKRLVDRIVENVTAGVVGVDREGRVLFANRLARELLAAEPGRSLLDGLADDGLAPAREALGRDAAPGEPIAARVRPGGAEREWTFVRVALPGGSEPSELVVVEDVTDVARGQRLEAWASMARIIAHEVKNPLTPIRLSTEHLREAWARDREHFSEVFERCTRNILVQVEELRRTASEFSLFSEIPRLDARPGELGEALTETVEAYRAAPPAGITVSLRLPDEPVRLAFDRRLLGRAVRNLLENAIRASAGGGEVEVRLDVEGDEAVVRVADAGPGVPEPLLGRIVEPYFSTHSGGTGLGLPIARRVVEEHGGRLSVRNRPSGGLEVTLTIPRR